MTTSAVARPDVPADTGIAGATLHEVFAARVARHPDDVFVRDGGTGEELTWAQVDARMRRVASGLAGLGVARGDRVALMLPNAPVFSVCDLAVVGLGAVPVSVYGTASPEQIAHVVGDAGVDVLVCDAATLPRVRASRESSGAPRRIVVVDGEADEAAGETTLASLEDGTVPDVDLDAETARSTPDDLLTMIYTSGTTGPPKGVELTHDNLLGGMRAMSSVVGLREGGRVISWLPAAHIAERGAHYYAPLLWGLEVTTCADPRTIANVLPAVRPTWFFAVPRIWEKLKAAVEAGFASQPDAVRDAARAAVARGVERVELEQAGDPVPDDLRAACTEDDERIFAGLRAKLGLDAAHAVNAGSAPIPRDVVVFFHAIGLPVGEIWGMSEACACGTVNAPGATRIGSVGRPLPGIELRLEDDGEILLRGRPLMRGYRGLSEKTRESMTDDGYFRTGDVGRIDEDGYLFIVDRKKELIINSSGKNMSPANIESALKSQTPLIGQAVAIGDGRPYVTALLVLDPDAVAARARERGEEPDLEALASDAGLRAELQEAVDAGNARLARVEHVRRFVVLADQWAPGGDELTPTSKLRRAPIHERYAEEIEGLYRG
ncbi:AMP-dependent synthetase/ligase [Patulibacter minatonensis]|uniref:AMP-dependent synthetase/ligase n=1 Tax=Patulibacter minatonensis TaxID=298163 RepID=UPI00047D0B21|nr:long-chain fatty acid--CoA ligase [Patulibacter minatonensis]